MGSISIKQIVPHAAALITFLVISCLYFFPQIEGKTLSQTDINSYKGMVQEVIKYEEETGETSLWTNSIFSGMPTYQIRIGKGANKVRFVEKIAQLFISRPIGLFIGAMVGFYLLMLVLGVNPWLAIVGSVGFALCTNNMVLYEAGHTSKLRSIFWAAPVIAGAVLTYRKQYVIGGGLFTLAMAVNLFVNHFQMTYYLFMLLGIYGLFVLRDAVKARDYKPFLIATAILVGGTLLAVGSSASKILTTQEYTEDTMRGKPILEDNAASATSSSETEGLAWDYAMNWSNGVPDVLAMLVPRAAGGSGAERTGENSELFQDFRRRGIRLGGEFAEPLYWGDLPFTGGPAYMGALLIFLFILGAILVPGRFKWWLVTCVVLTVLMSMGKHFAVLNQLLFDYLPFYNKFRAPSSILTITSVFIPVLGILGLVHFFRKTVDNSRKRKALLWSLATTGGVCVLLAAVGPSLFSLESASDASYANAGYNVDAIVADRARYLRADALRSLLFIALGAAALFAFLKGSAKAIWVTVAIGLLAMIDLWGVNRRYISPDDFVTKSLNDQAFALRDVDREILRDEDLHYRVHDVTVDPWNNSIRSYHHKTIGGYNPAKLQRYQDLIDYYLSRATPHILNMLNARYFIVPGDSGPRVQRNFQAFGNAWFVEGIRIVDSADEEIAALENLDPMADAVVHRAFEPLVAGFDPVKNGTIELIEYKPNKLTYRSSSESDQLAVFSEIWYGPDKGWQAYIDGQPVEHLRANYVLRALNVPAGQHTIVFEFDPQTYRLGETLSLIFSLIILLGFAGVLWYTWNRQPPPEPKKEVKPARTKSKRKGGKKKSGGQ